MSQTQTAVVRTRPAPSGKRSDVARVLARLRRQPGTLVAGAALALLVLITMFAPLIAPYDPTAADLGAILQPPSAAHPLGTDDLGRDQLSTLLYGARIVLVVAFGSVVVAALIGVPIGLLIGYRSGWWDRIGMRGIDMLQSLPGMLIGITVVAILGRTMWVLMLAIGLVFASGFVRMVRGSVLAERRKAYVEAAEVAGLTQAQVLFGQILPNVAGPVITQAAVYIGSAITIESAMSFLGVGLDAESASWGAMLSLALEQQSVAPYLTWAPGIAIVLTVLAFNVFGDGLNDALTGERRLKPRPAPKAAAPVVEPGNAPAAQDAPLLAVSGVTVALDRSRYEEVDIVKDASLTVARGEIVGILGESGSGKSTFARAVLGMLPAGTRLRHGSIRLDGEELAGLTSRQLQQYRGARMGAVFQDPMAALSPVHTVGRQLTEPLRIHKGMSTADARKRAVELLDRVGVVDAAGRLDAYPHEFSGGMAQRVAIAMALAAEPDLLIADEATSALDVTTQAQVLDLILDLRDEYGLGVLMITHSLGVVAEACDRAAVLYRGRIVEDAPVTQLFDSPHHPYTRALLAANPANAGETGRLRTIDAAERAAIDAEIDLMEVR
ncbi:dipeptide/oligopeptide/nickel ABC transporter permease/ATP-binding protein [Microbacterium sp. NPDC096154]|uniref:dipeptide/oligopeptide/nickel ABC transporter permease/ATP-binding protein n=1 Tax=Microbacterium sp. NPDC096154 TaxID=3155549 RepID=UPI003328978E